MPKKLNKEVARHMRKLIAKSKYNLPTESKESYAEFLKTKYWAKVSARVLKRDKRRCKMCGSKKDLNVHHKTYANHFRELSHMDDLITLCRTCHKKVHGISKR